MATDLTGLKVKDTYNSLLKIGDNSSLSATPDKISDGFGNESVLYLSTSQVSIGALPASGYDLTVGNSGIKTGRIDIVGAATAASVQLTGGSGSQGTLSWNTDEETVDIIQNGAVLQLGQETHVHVKNQSGATINDGTPVYVTGTLGASGRLTVAPMIADGSIEAKYFIGVTTEDIPNGEDGKVTTFGKIRGLDTTAYSEGQTLYVSASTAGYWQTTRPVAPNLDLEVAIVINVSANNGTIFVRAQNGHYLGMLHDVYESSPSNNDLLVYNNTNSRWENQGIASIGSINLDTVTDNGNTTTNSISVGDINAGNVTLTGYLRGAANFVIDPAAHGDETGVVQILGDLRVDGTTTTINSTTVTIDDKNIELASGSATAADANGAGITIDGADATMTYNSTSDRFVFNKNIETDLVGNADTASALETARNIAVDGAVTGNADFDGSGDITITTSVNHNHDADYVNVTGDTMTGDLDFNDDVKAKFGTGDDLTIYHNATNSFIDNATGSILIRNLTDDQDIVLATDDGTGSITDYLRADGSEGSVKLFHYGSQKLVTTSTGVSVTGAFSGNLDTSSISGGTIDINGTTAINLQYNGSTQLRIDSLGVAYLGTVTFANDGISLTDEDSTTDSFFHANVDYDAGLYTVTSNARYGADYIQVDGLDSREETRFVISPKDIGDPDPHAYLYIGGDNSITAPNTLVDWHTIEINALSVQINNAEVATQTWVTNNVTNVIDLDDVTTNGAITTNDISTGRITIANNVSTGGFGSFDDYQILLYEGGDADTSYGIGIEGNTMMFNSDTNYRFYVDNSIKVTINSSGNVSANSFSGGNITSTETITGDTIKLTNDATDTSRHRIAVYDSSTTSYGMMLWNTNAASGEWATMIYGPKQSNRRISFGKVSGTTFSNHADVTEIAHFDLDTSRLYVDGGVVAGIGGEASWGDALIDTSLSAGWGTTTEFPFIGSTGGTVGSIIMLHNPHIPYRTDNALSGYDGRAGLRLARNADGDYWDAGLAGDFFHIYRNGTGEFLRIDNTGRIGINNPTPQGTLHLTGGSDVGAEIILTSANTVNPNNNLGSIWFGSEEGSGYRAAGIKGEGLQDFNSADTPASLVFYTTSDGSGTPAERMRINSTGRTTFQNVVRLVGTTSGTSQIDLPLDYGALRWFDGTTFKAGIGAASWSGLGSGDDIGFYLNSGDLHIGNQSSAFVTFDRADERVGIGNTTPSTALEVTGAGALNSYRGVIRIENTSTAQWAGLAFPDDVNGTDSASNNYYFIGRGGAIGDRTMSFHIPTAADYTSGAEPYFRFSSTGADDLMTIEATSGDTFIKGDLGIGTAPSDKLHVVGNTKFDGNVVIDTDTGANALYITRSGATNQSMKIYTDDVLCYFVAEQDENAGSYGSIQMALDAGGTDNSFTITDGVNGTSLFQVKNNGNGGFFNSGSFAIGKSSTTYGTLDVEGAGSFKEDVRIYTSTTTNQGGITMYDTDGDGYLSIAVTDNEHPSGWGWQFQSNFANSATGTVYFRIGYDGADSYLNSGNFGIGTNLPSAKLQVKGADNINAFKVTDSGDGDGFKVTSHSTQGTYIQAYDASHTQTIMLDARNDSGSRHSYFNGGGNVGIGETSPSAKLEVNGALAIQNGSQINLTRSLDSDKLWYGLRYDNNEVQIYTYNAGGRSITFNTVFGGTAIVSQLMKIQQDGNVGINTPSPDYKLHVNASSIQPTADLLMGEVAFSSSNSYVGLKTTNMSGANDYMIISGKTDGNTYVSAKDGGQLHLRGGGNWSANQITVYDGNYVTTSGGHRFGTGGTPNWGNAIVDTGSGAGWGSGNYPYIGSVNGSTGSLIMLHNIHVPMRTDNKADSSYAGRAGMRCARDTNASGWWDIGLAGDFFQLFRSSTGELFRVTNNGTVHADNDVVAFSTTTSDKRLKDNIKTIDNALDKVMNLRGVSYTWNNGSRKGQKDLGVIAQEVEQVIPEIVREHELPLMDDSGEKYKTVDYEKMVGVLIEAMKEQQKQIDELKSKLDGITN